MQSFSSLTRPNEQSRDRSESLTQSYAQAEVKVVFSLRLARPLKQSESKSVFLTDGYGDAHLVFRI